MNRSRRETATLALLVVPLLLLAAGCSDETTGPQGPGTVVLELDQMVGNDPLALNTAQYTNAAGNQYSVSLLEYVLSDFRLRAGTTSSRADSDFEADFAHYRNHADASTRAVTLGDVPSGTYEKIEFVWGIDGSKNVTGAYPELDLAGMAWPTPMGGGYHYMRNEGTFLDASQQSAGFTTHVGPSMGTDFSFPVTLDHNFTVTPGETTTIRLSMDINEWYANPTVYDFNDYGATMGNPAAQQVLHDNGADVWSLAP